MADAALTHSVDARTLFVLGRVSNLPTVWTNTLAATVIAGGAPFSWATFWVLLAMTLFYTGGMYLNDAFDRQIDARERPGRPIPSGRILARAVFTLGFGMLAGGLAILAAFGMAALVAGLALAVAIVAYDAFHKGNPVSPLMMGLCRALVYVGAAAALGAVSPGVLLAALAVFAHVVGLTYAAKQESLDRIGSLWPLAVLAVPLAIAAFALDSLWASGLAWAALALADISAVWILRARSWPGAVPYAVGCLIAAVSLVDALMVAPYAPHIAALCAAGYVLTRVLHRVVPGT